MTLLLANLLGPHRDWQTNAIISAGGASLMIIVGIAIWFWRNRKSN